MPTKPRIPAKSLRTPKKRALNGRTTSGRSLAKTAKKINAVTDRPTATIGGQLYYLIRADEFEQLLGSPSTAASPPAVPALPPADANGNRPALETVRALIARGIIQRRAAVGLSQAELARQAGIPPETLNRIERAVYAPSATTAEKIERALRAAEGRAKERE